IDAAHSQHENRWATLYGRKPIPAELAHWLGGFDLVMCYWPDPEGELKRRFPLHPGQTALFATAVPGIAPAAAHFCAPLPALRLLPGSLIFPLRTPAPKGLRVAIHPGSGSPQKNWPVDRWEMLARWLESEIDAEVVVITGEAEPEGLLRG